jgi:hypothetical protein
VCVGHYSGRVIDDRQLRRVIITRYGESVVGVSVGAVYIVYTSTT